MGGQNVQLEGHKAVLLVHRFCFSIAAECVTKTFRIERQCPHVRKDKKDNDNDNNACTITTSA